MQFKKRYVVVVVLLLLGLTTFTFASPRQVEKQKTSKGISERVSSDKKENKSYAEALQAVEDAEENPTLETVETARNEIRNADDATVEQVNQLEQRVEVVEETIDVAALVKEVETLAEVKETRDDAKAKYPNAETEVNKLEEGDVKDNLVSRLAKVSRLLNDTDAPVVTGVDENVPTNKNEIVYVNDEFLISVTIDGKEYTEFTADGDILKFEKKITTEGTHTVTAIDKLGNETTKTFTIDKTAAKKNAVNANVNGYKNEVKEQYATNGNTVTAYISINEELKHNPTFTFYANGKEIKVIAKEDVIARASSNAKYPYVYEVKLAIDENLEAEDGELTFTVTDIVDKAGNKTADITKVSNGKVVKLDRTPNRVTFTTISTDNENVEGKVYYVTAGDTVTFRMGVREKFSENPVVTIGGKEVTLEYVKYFKEPNHHEYKGTLKLDETLTDGNLAITISNLTDELGNKGFYYQTNGKKVLETVTKKETTNGKSLVYDNTAPVLSYVAMLSKADNYKYAKNGDTIRFLVAYNEPIELNDNFVITFNNKTKKLVRSGDKTKYEYIAEFKIPADEKDLAEGLLTFEVKGAQDKLGNEALASTTANHYKYNSVTYDRTAPTLTVKSDSVGVEPYYTVISYKLSDNTLIDYYTINGYKADVTNNKWGDANYGNLKSHLVAGENKITLYDVAGNKTVKTFNIAKNTAKVEDGNVTVNEDIYLVNEPFYNEIDTENEVTINGNGKTVTQYITSVDKLQWKGNHKTPNGLNIPLLGDVFSSKNGAKVTVNNITFTGTIHSIMLGNYEDSSSNWFNTEFNNVNIINTKVVSLAGNIAPAAVVYGKATLNNVNIYGTTRSELENAPDDPYWPIYDLGLVNYSNTTLNGGKIGSIYMWKHAKLTVKAGTTVDSINVTLGTPMSNIVVEEGATVNKIITRDGEMPYEEWEAQINYTTVNSVEEFKNALNNGYRKIIIANTLNIEEDQKFSPTKKTFVTTKDTITMFNVKEGKSLTLENLVLDGENTYKVDAAKAAEIYQDAFNIFNMPDSLNQERVYKNTPLIKTAGKLTLGKNSVIRNYAHQPYNGTNGQQYGGPAIQVTDGTVTINGLEFTNNISQLLTAKNATVTIDNINVHDTWANGNKAGLVEINADATMNVNNGTFKNNMMTMRSYGLFIANAGTINMKGGLYENNQSTRNGGNTAGSLFGVETTGKIYMTGGTVQNNIGYRAGAFATRWATDGSVIELNGGIIKNNTTRDSAFKNAAIFVQSNVKIGTDMVVEDKVVLRGATAVLDNNGKIVGDVELVDNLGKFNNNGTVTGTIIVPEV